MLKAVDPFDESLVHPCTALGHALFTYILEQGPPQLGLPAVARCQGFAFATGRIEDVLAGSPILEPVGTIDLILVEQVSQALCQLIAFA
ncbi:hypothetical protein D3C79_647050 [compost metagenome]